MAKGKPKAPQVRKTLIALKGEPVWLEWLNAYADHLGISATTAIDLALRDQAKRDGFTEPMPKRFAR
jgi:hypothetical protein